jgi:hypothetical protein
MLSSMPPIKGTLTFTFHVNAISTFSLFPVTLRSAFASKGKFAPSSTVEVKFLNQ